VVGSALSMCSLSRTRGSRHQHTTLGPQHAGVLYPTQGVLAPATLSASRGPSHRPGPQARGTTPCWRDALITLSTQRYLAGTAGSPNKACVWPSGRLPLRLPCHRLASHAPPLPGPLDFQRLAPHPLGQPWQCRTKRRLITVHDTQPLSADGLDSSAEQRTTTHR
jgi:hypothetical protein